MAVENDSTALAGSGRGRGVDDEEEEDEEDDDDDDVDDTKFFTPCKPLGTAAPGPEEGTPPARGAATAVFREGGLYSARSRLEGPSTS